MAERYGLLAKVNGKSFSSRCMVPAKGWHTVMLKNVISSIQRYSKAHTVNTSRNPPRHL